MSDYLLTTGEASYRLGISVVRIRQLADLGTLPPAYRLGTGERLFRPEDVEALALDRSRRAALGKVRRLETTR